MDATTNTSKGQTMTKTTIKNNKTLGRMAAMFRMSESGVAKSERPLPLRYGLAADLVAIDPTLRTMTWGEYKASDYSF